MGSARASRMLLSRSVFSPSMTMLTSRPICLAVSRTTRGRRRNICSTGTMRIFITERCSLLRICDWKSRTSEVRARRRTVAEAAIHLGQQLLHHALGDDELADQVEDHVDALGLDADHIFGGRGEGARRGPCGRCGIAGCARSRSSAASLVRSCPLRAAVGAASGRCGRREDSAAGWHCAAAGAALAAARDARSGCPERALSPTARRLRRHRMDLGDHGGNLALALHPVERVMTGKSHLDDVGNLGAALIGTHHQDGADLLQDIAHQLHGGGAHGAGGIDGEREVVDLLAAHRVFGDQQALVFGPVELRREGGFRAADCAAPR